MEATNVKLAPIRRIIIMRFKTLSEKDRRSRYYIIKQIAQELGYSLDQNGSNSYIMKVIRELEPKT